MTVMIVMIVFLLYRVLMVPISRGIYSRFIIFDKGSEDNTVKSFADSLLKMIDVNVYTKYSENDTDSGFRYISGTNGILEIGGSYKNDHNNIFSASSVLHEIGHAIQYDYSYGWRWVINNNTSLRVLSGFMTVLWGLLYYQRSSVSIIIIVLCTVLMIAVKAPELLLELSASIKAVKLSKLLNKSMSSKVFSVLLTCWSTYALDSLIPIPGIIIICRLIQ